MAFWRRTAAIFVAALLVGGAIGYTLAYHRDWVADTIGGAESRTALIARPCGFTTESGRDMVCYDLKVPERRGRAGSRLVTLPIIVFKAAERPTHADPVLLIGGGPGAIAYTEPRYASMWRDKFKDMAWIRGRDLIVYDQRGVGGARPALECPEIDATRDEPLDIERGRKAMIACRERLVREGTDTAAYDTETNVADLLSLKAQLGVKEWNLWGQSYGTRVALTLMRRNPAGVRSVILDGAYPPEVAGKLHLATAFIATLDRIFAACAGDSACNEDYPDLRRKFETLLKRLKEQPPEIKSDPSPLLPAKVFKVNDVIFLSIIDSMFYTADGIGKFPWLVDKLLEGKNEAIEDPLIDWDLVSYGPYITAGISYLVDCNDTPEADDSEEKTLARTVPYLAGWLNLSTAYKPCPYWVERKTPALDRTPVTSDVPTLVIAGGFDLATPPAWGALAAKSLTRARLVTVPAASHDASDHACAQAALRVFIAQPGADVAAACDASPAQPPFKRKSEDD